MTKFGGNFCNFDNIKKLYLFIPKKKKLEHLIILNLK